MKKCNKSNKSEKEFFQAPNRSRTHDLPTGIWKIMGSTPVGGSEKFFSDLFYLLHFFDVSEVHIKLIMFYRNEIEDLPLNLVEGELGHPNK